MITKGAPSVASAPGQRRIPGSTATVAVTLAAIGAFLNLYATQPLLPLLSQVFSASKPAVGMTVSASTIGVALSAPFCGLLAERLGRKQVIVLSMLLLSIPTAMAGTSGSLAALVFWRFLQGVVTPGVFGVTVAYITEEWPASRVAAVISMYVTGTIFGGFTGRTLIGFFATHQVLPFVPVSWRTGFFVIAACDLLFFVLMWRWLPPDTVIARHAEAASPWDRIFAHLRNRQLVATYAVGFSVLFTNVAVFTYITFYLAAPPFNLTPAQLSWLFGVYLFGLVVTPLGGRWLARVGSRKGLIRAMLVGMLGGPLTFVHSLPVVVLGLVVFSSGVFIGQCAASSYLQTAAPAGERASAAGLYVSFYYIGGTLAGVLPGYVWPLGGWTACVILVLLMQVITLAIAASGWRPKPSESQEMLPAVE